MNQANQAIAKSETFRYDESKPALSQLDRLNTNYREVNAMSTQITGSLSHLDASPAGRIPPHILRGGAVMPGIGAGTFGSDR